MLVVDNHDSFVFNLVQYLGQLGAQSDVWRNDDPRLAGPAAIAAAVHGCDGVLLSPGPGTPQRAGASVDIVRACAVAAKPLLGTLRRFRPAYERRLGSSAVEPAFDLDGALARARRMTGRDDPGAHLGETP